MVRDNKYVLLQPGSTYHSVHFSGSGFLLPFFMGVATALRHFKIKFDTASGSSGGVMAALAVLGGGDMDLGIRQCFDLRFQEAATVPGSISSFFNVYRQYFRSYRRKLFQERVSIQSLKNRLFVRLGRWSGCWWEVFTVSEFDSEKDLEDAFMSAAYIPMGTSVLPPFFRGEFAMDAALIDYFVWGAGTFSSTNPTLWPPGPVKSGVKDIKMVVAPFSWNVQTTSNLIAITGGFRKLLDFWASRDAMERAFCDGYQQMVARIEFHQPMTHLEMYNDPKEYLNDVFVAYSDWKIDLGFVTPEVVFERDPVAVVAVIFAFMVCGFNSNIYSLVFLTIALLFAVACMLLYCGDGMFSKKLGKCKIRYKSKLRAKLVQKDI